MSKKVRVALCLDRSTSMLNLKDRMFQAAGSMIKKFRDENDNGLDISIAVITFSTAVNVVSFPTDVRNFSDTAISKLFADIHVGGNTSLWDATKRGIDTINNDDDKTSYAVIVFTDGEENASMISATILQKQINDLERLGNWSIAFNIPKGGGYRSQLVRMGISNENINEWEQTQKGVEELEVTTNAAITQYTNSLRSGARSVRNFYQPVVVNTDNLKDKDLNKLTDVSSDFKVYKVTKDGVNVKDFTEEKTRKLYVTGQTYYQLTKPEKVGGSKEVLIIKQGDSAIYAGPNVRKLVGLPTDGTDAKVIPGNFKDKLIFVASTSVNRKLVKDTKILVNTKMKKGLPDTWQKF